MNSRYQTARRFLIFWTLFIGVGAVAGAVGMLVDPSGKAMGMDAMLPYFQVLPMADVLFQDFVFSGIALFIVNGVTNLTAAGLLLAKRKSGVIAGGIFGGTLMLWICIQFYMFPMNFMSTAYFVFGFCQAATGYAAWVFEKQESFCAAPADEGKIGTNPRRLVVFFSRMGYVKKRPMRRPSAPERRFMKSKPRKKRMEPRDFGGAADLPCIDGICRFNRLTLTFPATSM